MALQLVEQTVAMKALLLVDYLVRLSEYSWVQTLDVDLADLMVIHLVA